MLKSKASKFLKRITLVLASMAKAKTLALRNKTNALRTRLMIFSLLRDNRKILINSISQKLHALVSQQEHDKKEEEDNNIEDQSQAIVLYNHSTMSVPNPSRIEESMENAENEDENGCFYGYGYAYEEVSDDEEKFPDLTHSLFDEDLEFEDPGGSVIDLVKNSKKEGEEFSLEDEIDHVADLFIRRFHRQMRMQKQLSIKRHQEMLERSA